MLTFITGPVNSGKTAQMLIKYYNMKKRSKKNVRLCHSDKCNSDSVTSRIKDLTCKVDFILTDDFPMYNFIGVDVLFIDESQFLNKSILRKLLKLKDMDIYCYGLTTDSSGKLWESSKLLLSYSDCIEQVHTICEWCESTYAVCSKKVGGNSDRIEISHDKYIPLCSRCFLFGLVQV